MHISMSDIQYDTSIPKNNYDLLPVVPSTISPPPKHLPEFPDLNTGIENQDYSLINSYNNDHNHNSYNDYNGYINNTDINSIDNNVAITSNITGNITGNINAYNNNTYNNNTYSTNNIIYLSQQQNSLNLHLPTYQKQAYPVLTVSDQAFDNNSNSNQVFYINNNNSNNNNIIINNINNNLNNDYLMQDNSSLLTNNSNYLNYSSQIINHNNPSEFLPQVGINRQLITPTYSYENSQFVNPGIQNRNLPLDKDFLANNNSPQTREAFNPIQSNNICPSNVDIKNSTLCCNQDKSIQFKNFNEFESSYDIEHKQEQEQELEHVHEHEHGYEHEYEHEYDYERELEDENSQLLINPGSPAPSLQKRSDGFLQLSKEEIANEIHNVEIIYKEKLANLLNSEEYKTFASNEKQTNNGSKKRRRFDKIVLECPIKDCKYNGSFKTCDYLKRHIREQHGQNSRLHFCKGFDHTKNTYWGCGKSFKRMYQLANHWRGNRSKKKCRVPQYEMQKLNIRKNH